MPVVAGILRHESRQLNPVLIAMSCGEVPVVAVGDMAKMLEIVKPGTNCGQWICCSQKQAKSHAGSAHTNTEYFGNKIRLSNQNVVMIIGVTVASSSAGSAALRLKIEEIDWDVDL